MTSPRAIALTLAPLTFLALAACGDDASGTGGAGGDGGATSSTGTTGSTSTAVTTTASTGAGQGGDDATGGAGAGGDPAGSGGGGGAATTGSGGGTSAFPDDCATSDDCGGGECISINGFRTCQRAPAETTECTGSGRDECCDTTGCAEGERCARLPDVYCGGAAPTDYNACIGPEDECLDCGKLSATCVPGGALGYEIGACVSQACGSDADCDAEDGGRCLPVDDPCCGAVSFQCAYPSDGCRTSADCDEGSYCGVDVEAERARCLPGIPTCAP